jgi:hypothetical protein
MNDDFLLGLMDKLIQIVEFQTQIGLKLKDVDEELKAIQDQVNDLHNMASNRFDELEVRWEK